MGSHPSPHGLASIPPLLASFPLGTTVALTHHRVPLSRPKVFLNWLQVSRPPLQTSYNKGRRNNQSAGKHLTALLESIAAIELYVAHVYIKEPFHLPLSLKGGCTKLTTYSGTQLILYVLSAVLSFDLNVCAASFKEQKSKMINKHSCMCIHVSKGFVLHDMKPC